MDAALPYLLGGLGGGGVLCVYYGLARLRDPERPEADRRKGLWLVNLGVAMLGVSMALFLWQG
ncbi:MAG: hypothetical protein QNJ94_15430 [Alphaproteobacteria bacterium]|nr:hypothetical protein [Alphaproteobacteria bacterium]